jgi:hypothetical protein
MSKKKKPSKKANRVKSGRSPTVAARPDSLPVVRPINSFELRPADREEERQRARDQGGEYFVNQIGELVHSKTFMDRVCMRNAIYRIQICVEEHADSMQLTAEERSEWMQLASSALTDTDVQNVPLHCSQLFDFWQTYRLSQHK